MNTNTADRKYSFGTWGMCFYRGLFLSSVYSWSIYYKKISTYLAGSNTACKWKYLLMGTGSLDLKVLWCQLGTEFQQFCLVPAGVFLHKIMYIFMFRLTFLKCVHLLHVCSVKRLYMQNKVMLCVRLCNLMHVCFSKLVRWFEGQNRILHCRRLFLCHF